MNEHALTVVPSTVMVWTSPMIILGGRTHCIVVAWVEFYDKVNKFLTKASASTMLTIKKTVVINVQQQTLPAQRPRPPYVFI